MISAPRNISVRTTSCSLSEKSRPSALKTPGAGGTSTCRIPSARAISTPVSGPLPPNAHSAKSRGSRPRYVVTALTARVIVATDSCRIPCAASSTERPSGLRHDTLERLLARAAC